MKTVQDIPGEPLRYLVPSDTVGKPPYLVDLSAFNGNGRCVCTDFETRRRIALREGELSSEKTRCKHIRRARVHMLDRIISDYLKRQRETNKNTATHHCKEDAL